MPKEIKSILPEKKERAYVGSYEQGYNQALTEIEALLPDMLALIREEIEEEVKVIIKEDGIWEGKTLCDIDDILNILK
jgi:hypothetical protein